MVQPKAVAMPASKIGRRSSGSSSSISLMRRTSSSISAWFLRTFALLCVSLAETGMLTLCVPAATARSTPLRFGASVVTCRPGMVTA